VGAIWRLSVADVAQSLLFLPVADTGSVCEDAAAFDSARARHAGGYGVLRDRRCLALSQHPERDPLLRPALAGGHGHDDGGDSDRAAELSCEPGLRIPSWRVFTIEQFFYRSWRSAADRDLRLLGCLQHKFPGCGSARSRPDHSTSDRVVSGAGGGSL